MSMNKFSVLFPDLLLQPAIFKHGGPLLHPQPDPSLAGRGQVRIPVLRPAERHGGRHRVRPGALTPGRRRTARAGAIHYPRPLRAEMDSPATRPGPVARVARQTPVGRRRRHWLVSSVPALL
ncbi:hypothetical protein PR048_006165 [Dryococelus australis]|uniref:Uncharacterized protein n=1 Tax=Dryococelus australis TaxID=614101 RepID=A0ABQ9IAA3_9NEOP|nr:hypothetical protein PR048_006165 [Dryococelus australis]